MNSKYLEAKDQIYALCILLSRIKFRFDGKENLATELPKHLQNRRSK